MGVEIQGLPNTERRGGRKDGRTDGWMGVCYTILTNEGLDKVAKDNYKLWCGYCSSCVNSSQLFACSNPREMETEMKTKKKFRTYMQIRIQRVKKIKLNHILYIYIFVPPEKLSFFYQKN